MVRLKRLLSREILRLLGDFGFTVEFMRGSHAKLVQVRYPDGDREVREVLVVPMHRASLVGTMRTIYRQASWFVPEDELRPRFFG